MAKFTNELNNYQNIPRELVFDTTLSDRARFVYCFMACKPNDWEFFLEPMAKELRYSIDTLRKYINELVESGWLQKGEQCRDKGEFRAVEYILKALKIPTRKNTDTEKYRHGKIPIQHNIDSKHTDSITDNNKDNNNNKFNFLQALIDLGVDEQIAKDWLIVRKDKKATNTQTAFNRIVKEIGHCSITPNECITIAVERSWSGFKAEWLDNLFNKKHAFKTEDKPMQYKKHKNEDLLKIGIIENQNGVMLLEDGTIFKNGHRYYISRDGNEYSIPIDEMARPDDRYEYKQNQGWYLPFDLEQSDDLLWD